MTVRRLLAAFAALVLTPVLLGVAGTSPAAASQPSAAAVRTIRYDASRAAEFRAAVDQGAQVWNSHVRNVRLVPGTPADIVVYADDGWPRAQPRGLGRGTVWMGRTAVWQGYDEVRIAAHELGHILGLPDRRTGRCTADEDDIDGCSCVDLRTRGLRRFGLPELEITDVACPHDLAALNVLRTAAQRLLPLSRHPGEHILPPELTLTSADFASFWGCQDPVWDDGPIPVRLVEAGPRRLGIRSPAGFPGTLNEWLWDELPPVLHELLSCEPDRAVLNGLGG